MKMYFLVLYNLSPIQQWIQAWHSALEYVSQHRDTPVEVSTTWENLKSFVQNHKTWIILNGWTSSDIRKHINTLSKLGIPHSIFREPDLWNIVTSVCFIDDWENPIIPYFTRNFKLA